MENLEKQIVRIIENNSPELAAEEILRLLGVVGRSEQFYCAERYKVGYTCEDGQCDKCKMAETMPEQ